MKETQETQVQSLDQEDPLEEKMATGSSIHAWKNPWREEPSPWGLQSMGVAKSWTRLSTHACTHFIITIPVHSEQDLDNAGKAPEDA